MYWVRSFVPMLKKSTRRASSGARKAADGTSIMIPVTIRSATGTPGADEGRPGLVAQRHEQLHVGQRRDHRRHDVGHDVGGRAGRQIARSWVRSRSGLA